MKETLLVVIPVLITAFATYLVARRKSSGRIAHSEASDLWAESQSIRKELRDRVVVLENRISDLEAAREKDRVQIADLKAEIKILNDRLKGLS